MHPIEKTDSEGARPVWLGSAQIKVSGSYSVRCWGLSNHQNQPLAPSFTLIERRLITGNYCFPYCPIPNHNSGVSSLVRKPGQFWWKTCSCPCYRSISTPLIVSKGKTEASTGWDWCVTGIARVCLNTTSKLPSGLLLQIFQVFLLKLSTWWVLPQGSNIWSQNFPYFRWITFQCYGSHLPETLVLGHQ